MTRPSTVLFTEWGPDLPDLNGKMEQVAKNARPKVGGYGSFPDIVPISDALDSYPRGAVAAADKDNNVEIYAADAGKLYKLVSGAWQDRSKGGGYAVTANEQWEAVTFDQKVLFSCVDEPLQSITFGGANFADALTSTAKPQARHIGVVDRFVVLGNTWDATDGNVPEQVWWLAAGSTTDADKAQATLSDAQILRNGGAVQRIIGGKSGLVFKEDSIYRMQYANLPDIFAFVEVERKRGALAPGSVMPLGRFTFFWARDGFYVFDGMKSEPLGENKFDETILNDIDRTYLHRIKSNICTQNSCYFMCYAGAGNVNGLPNRLFVYNWKTRKGVLNEIPGDMVFGSLAQGYTLEDLDSFGSLDDLPASLDSPIWVGGEYAIAMFDSDRRLCYFTGDPLTAVFESAEARPYAPNNSYIDGITPLVEGADAVTKVQIGTRDTLNETVTWGAETLVNQIGIADMDVEAPYTRVRLTIEGGFDNAQGFIIHSEPGGEV